MLLQVHSDSLTISTLVPYIISAGGLLLAAYALFRKESREDGHTLPQRVQKLEAIYAIQEKRQEGFQIEIEHVADQARQARESLAENLKRDIESLHHQVKDVPDIRNLVNRMDERFKAADETARSLDKKMERVLTILTSNK